jgi:FkbM family methyltransferase
MRILYGIEEKHIDVTEICMKRLKYDKYLIIPTGDHNRALYFSDPLVDVVKYVFVDISGSISAYRSTTKLYIDTTTNTILKNVPDSVRLLEPTEKLNNLQRKLKLKYGSFDEELYEQTMAATYLTGVESVLEIGGNIGRNSLIIASILKDPTKMVVLESDPDIALQLTENRDINKLGFHIEASALSKRNLIQKGWETIVSDTVLNGYKPVAKINYSELMSKYNILFDTLILDCEGAFYYILQDMPEILNGINLIIMENDYNDIKHKEYVDEVLKNNNFYVDYSESLPWVSFPTRDNFFEVWKRSV